MQTRHRVAPVSVDQLLRALLPDPHANFSCLDTPYSKYINTPFAASEYDILAITDILQQPQAQLEDVAAEIAFVKSIIERVRHVRQQFFNKHDQVTASMKFHQSLLSCIPKEILSDIFVVCLPFGTYIEPDTKTAPFVLTGVCREWRRVALETLRLWCSLLIRHQGEQQHMDLNPHWLAHAKGCPLSVSIGTRMSQIPFQLMSLLLLYTNRITHLHIISESPITLQVFLRDVPMLEHLTLEGTHIWGSKIAITQPELSLCSLSLNRVTLDSYTVLSAFDLAWVHLKQLHVQLGLNQEPGPAHDADDRIVLALLEHCPHLEDFVLSPVFIPQTDITPLITHAHLRSLNVDVLRGVGYLLDALTLPALRHLQISDLRNALSTWRRNEFRSFVVRSQCALETLKIHPSTKIEQSMSVATHVETFGYGLGRRLKPSRTVDGAENVWWTVTRLREKWSAS